MQPAHLRTHPALQTGFTLIELVVSIIITAIVIGFMIMFIATPVQAYLAQGRRASLAHEAEISMHNLDIDLRSALPNSVRYTQSGSVLAIELWPVVDVASYRDSGSLGAGNALHELDFVAADTSFSNYIAFTKITYPFVSGQHHLVVNNLGQAGANVYAMNNVITPNGSSIRIDNVSTGSFTPALPANEDHVTISPGFKFASASARHHVYLVSTPVRYICNTSTNTLTRYANYTINSMLSTAVPSGGSSSQIASMVSSCSISCIPGTAQCSTVITLNMVFSKDGESLNAMQQVALDYSP